MALRLNTPERLKLSWSQKKNILRKALLIKIFWATWLKFQPPKVKRNTKMKKNTECFEVFLLRQAYPLNNMTRNIGAKNQNENPDRKKSVLLKTEISHLM